MKTLLTKFRLAATAATGLLALFIGATTACASSQQDLLKKLNDSLANSYISPAGTYPHDSIPFALMASPTVDDFLRLAERRNPGLRSSFYQWRAALKKSGYAGALPDPMFTYGYMVQDIGNNLKWQEQQLSLMQDIPWFGTLGTRRTRAFEAAEQAGKEYESKRLEVLYNVRAVLYEYWYLGRQIQLTRDNFDLLKFWESVARTRYQVALATHPDVIMAQVEMGKLEDRLHSLTDQREHITAKLAALLDLESSANLPIPDQIPQDEIEIADSGIGSEILRSNPDLARLEHRVREAKANRRLAAKASWPNFRVGVEHTIRRDIAGSAGSMSGGDPWMASVGISLPIWFGKNRAVREEAQATEHSARYALDAARKNLIAYLSQVVFKYQDALRRKRLYRDGLVPKAEQSLNATYAAYQSGDFDFLNVLDAQRQLLEFQLQLDRSTADVAISRAEIEMLLGRKLNANDNL